MTTSSEPNADAKTQIASVIDALVASWNRYDMEAYAALFTEDADFVNVLSMHWRGRNEIKTGLERVALFRNRSHRTGGFSLRQLAPNVVLANIDWEMTGHDTLPDGRSNPLDLRKGLIASVFVELQGRWLIAAAFHWIDIFGRKDELEHPAS